MNFFFKKARYRIEKTPPLGLYDVDQSEFMMKRSPKCFISNGFSSSHEYYYKDISKKGRKIPEEPKAFLTDRIEKENEIEKKNENGHFSFKTVQRKIKDHEFGREIKRKEDLSVKVLKNYDSNFWDKFLGGIKSMKDHIKKVRYIANSLGYGESGRLTQILKTNMI